ncbi:MAG: tetratricopeptide repeat protein, partial [Salibacteraceae bacterium]|nr:tetratricopeptide repeat protein [Salibacteraceae bacterium]
MMNLKGAIGTLCIMLFAGIAFGQKNFTQEADLTFQVQSYYAALDAYKKAYPKEKDNEEKARILYQVGECHRLLQQPDQALLWYQKAEAAEYKNPEMELHSGLCLMKQGDYEGAMAKFRGALSGSPTSAIKAEAELGIKACEEAVIMAKNPGRYLIKNEVQLNTKYYEFSPYFADKKLESLIFTSTRPAGGGNNLDPISGEGFSDIYITERDPKGKWSSPRPLSDVVNTVANEGSAVFDDKYSELYYTKCDYDEKKAFGCQIYKTRQQGQTFAEPELLDFGIDDTTVAAHPVFIDDDLILYVSDIRGGQGGKDLWYIRYEKKTKIWGPPVNLGPQINTAGDEMFPYIRENGDLYFASNG